MRMMLKVTIPVEAGNHAVAEGLLQKTVAHFVEQNRPEAAYFAPDHGKRSAYFFLDLKDTASLAVISEPFYANLNAKVEWAPVMNAADLKEGMDRLAKSRPY